MKIFTLTADGNYGGGFAVIAAEDEDDARRVGAGLSPSTWDIQWEEGLIAEVDGAFFNGTERVLDHYEMGE